eukprot:Em0025g53a
MSAAILRSAICAIFDDEDCQLDTPRMKLAKEAANLILDSSADCHHDGQDKFESFADKIVGTYQKLVPDPAIPKSKRLSTIRRGICGANSIQQGYLSFVCCGKNTFKAVL